MNQEGRWGSFPAGYRSAEIDKVLAWVERGVSGSVIGLRGSGRSTLLDFIWHRPDIWERYLSSSVKMSCITIDFNLMPDESLATLYRVILRAFSQARAQFPPIFQHTITTKFETTLAMQDAFPPQTALLDLLDQCQVNQIKVLCLLNRLDLVTNPQIGRTLRAFRDRYKGLLCYVVGSVQETTNRPDFDRIGTVHEVLDANVCWVGPLSFEDMRLMVARKLQTTPNGDIIDHIWLLTGGYPALVQAVCNWWRSDSRPGSNPSATDLLQHKETYERLRRLWQGLTQEEQYILSELQKFEARKPGKNKAKSLHTFARNHQAPLHALAQKGVCQPNPDGWAIFCTLLSEFVAQAKSRGKGKIWVDEETGHIYQGKTLLTLSPLPEKLLRFLVQNPRTKHTHYEIMEAVWEEDDPGNISTESLQQIITRVRKTIEPNPSKPVYILTWHGSGYYCIPEGQTHLLT